MVSEPLESHHLFSFEKYAIFETFIDLRLDRWGDRYPTGRNWSNISIYFSYFVPSLSQTRYNSHTTRRSHVSMSSRFDSFWNKFLEIWFEYLTKSTLMRLHVIARKTWIRNLSMNFFMNCVCSRLKCRDCSASDHRILNRFFPWNITVFSEIMYSYSQIDMICLIEVQYIDVLVLHKEYNIDTIDLEKYAIGKRMKKRNKMKCDFITGFSNVKSRQSIFGIFT